MVDWESLLNLKVARKAMSLSQTQLATLLGVSPRTVQSCEQGWRKPSPALEKMLLLLRLAHERGAETKAMSCWDARGCTEAAKADCLVHRTQQGHLCWLLSGNLCNGKRVRTWNEKKQQCGNCEFFNALIGGIDKPRVASVAPLR